MVELNDKELAEYERLNSDIKDKKEKPKIDLLHDNMAWIMVIALAIMQVVMSCLTKVDGSIEFVAPTTAWGWILLLAPKLVISVLGYMMWLTFANKGKDQAKKTEEYKKAQEILLYIQGKSAKNELDVTNPNTWLIKLKAKKGLTMAIMLFLTTFFVTELVVNWSLSSLIGSILSLLMALIYGLQVMDSTLEMFSIGYLRYATLLKVQFESRQKEEEEKRKAQIKQEEQEKQEALKAQIKQEEIKDNINNQENKNDALNAQYESQIKGDLINDNDRQSNVS